MDAELTYRMILLSLSSFLIGTTVVISVRYLFAWLERRNDWRGLLPLHVFVVTLSYDLLLTYATIDQMIRLGEHSEVVWWRAMLLCSSYVLGFIAMYSMAKLHRKKKTVISI